MKRLGKGIIKQYGKAASGFNVTSCQFFYTTLKTLQCFKTLSDIAECTHLGGYFIATAYDGKMVFDMLKNKSVNDGVSIYEDGTKLWEIKKCYSLNSFEDDSSCCGYSIDVFQESINQMIQEYLVNYDYLHRIMEDYGLQVLNRDEAQELGLPDGEDYSVIYLLLYQTNLRLRKEFEQYKEALNMNNMKRKYLS